MAKKRLNKNVVAALAFLGFATMIGLSVVMLLQLRNRDPQHFITLGDQSKAEGNWQQAEIYYGKAFDRSRDPRHLVLVGNMILEKGDVTRALTMWGNALVFDPKLIEAHERRIDLLLEFARLYGRSQDWKDLHESAEAMLKLDRDPKEVAFAHNANGLALLNMTPSTPEDIAKGQAELKQAVALAPQNVQFVIDQAIYLIRYEKESEGEKMLSDLTTRQSAPGADASKVNLIYAQYLSSRKKLDEAGKYFEKAIQLAGDDKDALVDARTSYVSYLTQKWAKLVVDPSQADAADKIYKEAESLMQQAIAADPDSYGPYLQLALLYQAAEKPEEALKISQQRIERPLSRKGVKGARNAYNMYSLMIRASENCVALAVAAAGKDQTQARDDWFKKAQQYVEDAKGELPAHPKASTQLARIRLAQANYRGALTELRAADEIYTNFGWIDWENKKLLARVHLQLNEPGAAKELLDEVLQSATKMIGEDSSFWTLYGQVLYRNDDLDRALAFADRVLATDPSFADAQQLKRAVLERKGQSQIVGTQSTSVAATALSEAREHLLNNNIEQALQALQKGLQDEPNDVQLNATTARLLIETGRSDDAIALLDNAAKQNPTESIFEKLRVLARKDISVEERDRIMLTLIDTETDAYKRALERIAFFSGKGEHQNALEAINEAEKHLVARDTPASESNTLSQHRALLMAKLRTATDLKNESALAEARDSAAKFDVDGAGGKSVLGAYHMARNEPELAIKALREAVVAQPTDARSLTLLAQCLQSTNAVDEAKAFYERAIRANPNEGLAHKGLAMMAKMKGETKVYDSHLARAERLVPADPWVQSEVLARGELANPQSAITRREQIRAEKPDDLQNIFRLATLYETTQNIPKADEYYEKVLSARADDRDVVGTVSKYYRRTKRPDKSLEVVNNFAQKQSTNEARADAQILVASHYLSEGDIEKCEKTLLDAAKMAETLDVTQSLAEFYFRPAKKPQDALPWFNKAVQIAEQRKSANIDNLLAARISCLLHPKVNDIDGAKKEIEKFMREYPEDTRGLLLLSEAFVRAGELDRATETLSEYLAKSPNDVTILFQRAQHYIAQGKMKLALADLEQIKRVNPLAMELTPRILLARLYSRTGQRDLGIREVEQLAEESDQDQRAVEELAETYVRENRLNDADRVVTKQLNRTTDANDPRWYFLRGRISMLLKDYDKALADFLRGADLNQHDNEAITRVLEAYARTERFTAGIAYHDTHASPNTKTAPILARYALLLARTGQEPKAVEQYRLAMEIARRESPDAVRDVTDQIVSGFPDRLESAVQMFREAPPTGELGRCNDRILARLYRLTDKIDDASKILDKLIDSAANDAERAALWYEKGEMYQLARNSAKAEEGYKNALRFAPDNWITLNNLAYLLADEMGQQKDALPFAQRAVAIADNPNTIDELHAALDTLGWIYVGLKEYGKATIELNRAVRLRPDQALTYYHLGEAYRRNQQFDQASEILEAGRRMAINMNDKALSEDLEKALQKNVKRDPAP